jgi:hypothetical protein
MLQRQYWRPYRACQPLTFRGHHDATTKYDRITASSVGVGEVFGQEVSKLPTDERVRDRLEPGAMFAFDGFARVRSSEAIGIAISRKTCGSSSSVWARRPRKRWPETLMREIVAASVTFVPTTSFVDTSRLLMPGAFGVGGGPAVRRERQSDLQLAQALS